MSNDNDNDNDKDPKIVKGPWLDANQLTQEVINDLNRLDQEEKFKAEAQQQTQPFEERVTVELIDYFQRSHKRKQELKQLIELNKIKAGMIEGLKLQETKLKQIIVELENKIKELENKK